MSKFMSNARESLFICQFYLITSCFIIVYIITVY